MRLYPPGTRKGNKTYIVRFYAGRPYEEPLDTTEGRVAQRRARQLVDAARVEARKSKATKGKPRTFKEAAERYADARGMDEAERRRLGRIVAEIGGIGLDEVSRDDIERTANLLLPHHAASTKNREVFTPSAAILHYAAENKWCSYQRIRKLKEHAPEPRRITAEDMETLLTAAASYNPDVWKLLLFLYLQGWRISEALRLKREHVNFGAGTLMAHVRKAKKWKPVPMHAEVAAALRAGRWNGDRVFPWGSVQAVYYHFAKLEQMTGIHFTAHMARYAFAGESREHGATSRDLVDMGTWTSVRSTERYQASTPEHAKSLVSKRGTKTGGNLRSV